MTANDALAAALRWAREGARLVLATASPEGTPHVSSAVSATGTGDRTVTVTAWLAPRAVANLERNPLVSLAVKAEGGAGCQLVGRVTSIREAAFLDGVAAEGGAREPVAQVQRELELAVDEVIPFDGHRSPGAA